MPPLVPTPMMGGGGKANASASIRVASRRLISRRITYQRSSGAVRSSQCARIGMRRARLEAAPPAMTAKTSIDTPERRIIRPTSRRIA